MLWLLLSDWATELEFALLPLLLELFPLIDDELFCAAGVDAIDDLLEDEFLA